MGYWGSGGGGGDVTAAKIMQRLTEGLPFGVAGSLIKVKPSTVSPDYTFGLHVNEPATQATIGFDVSNPGSAYFPAVTFGSTGTGGDGPYVTVKNNDAFAVFGASGGYAALYLGDIVSSTGKSTFASPEPRVILNETDQGTNEKIWDIDASGKVLTIRTRTDADAAGISPVQITRGTGTAISQVMLTPVGNANAAFTISGAGTSVTANLLSTFGVGIQLSTNLYTSSYIGLNSVTAVKWANGVDVSGGVFDLFMARAAAGAMTIHNGTTGIRLQTGTPTIASGFGTAAAITAGSTDTAGEIDIGTGGIATTGVINFATAWTTAPFVIAYDRTTGLFITASATTVQLTLTAATPFTANDRIIWFAIGPK